MNANTAGRIPQVDRVLRHPLIEEEKQHVRRQFLAELTRNHLEELRQETLKDGRVPDLDEIAAAICRRSKQLRQAGLKRVINATGVILNTNLGRAPLGVQALEHISDVAGGYCNLEFDLESGKRGERGARIEELLQLLTGCEAAIVVNNNAAAVLLAVSALSSGKEVIVSRGELIEIGDSFRLPEVVQSAGGILKEIGTTNRTRLQDYRNALSPQTGLYLRCHRSNFEITGFTEETSLPQLVEQSEQSGIPLLEDLGSGVLVDLTEFGLKEELSVQAVVKTGCGLVTFSGDKLLGGPQAGIVVGRRELVRQLRKSPLYRALRADKMVLAALEISLAHYLSPHPEKLIPALQMASLNAADLKTRAERFCTQAGKVLTNISCSVCSMDSAAGGGSLPGQSLPSYGIRIDSSLSANRMGGVLRQLATPVIAVIHEDKVAFDLRTVSELDDTLLLNLLQQIDSGHSNS